MTAPAAASLRAHRSRVAAMLAAGPERARFQWNELAQCPAWALEPMAQIDALAWGCGAWAHARELRRCIDGRVLAWVRERLGDAGFAALMDGPAVVASDIVADDMDADDMAADEKAGISAWDGDSIDPADLNAVFMAAGREWLLATIDASAWRQYLRAQWWPGMHAAAKLPQRRDAQAILDLALAHRAGTS